MSEDIKVLFLDIDGVLNSNESGLEFDPACVSHLNDILAAIPGLKIVISSSWRFIYSLEELIAILRGNNAMVSSTNVIGMTDDLYPQTRGQEIAKYVQGNNIKIFACLEDDEPLDEVKDRVVRCQTAIGLTKELAAEAIGKLK